MDMVVVKQIPASIDTAATDAVVRQRYEYSWWFTPIEFVFRGHLRDSSDASIQEAKKNVQKGKDDFKRAIQRIAQFIEEPKPQTQKKNPDFRFINWLNGSEREQRLNAILDNARAEVANVEELDIIIANLNKIREQNLQAVAQLYYAAYNAHYYNFFTTCGWTWWR